MDELSMIIVLSSVAFFSFFAISVFAYNSRKNHNLAQIVLASLLYAIALCVFYLDVKFLLEGRCSFAVPFITFLLILSSLLLFVRMIATLNKITSKFTFIHHLIYSIVFSFLLGYFTYIGNMYFRTITFYVGISIPLIIALYYYKISKLSGMFGLITAQIYLVFALIVANIVHYALYPYEILFTDPPNFVIAYLMMVNILIVTSIFSYIVERSRFDLVELEDKSLLLESMFNKVKLISETDELTGAFNRRKINEVISVLMKNFISSETLFSLLLIDIDSFKSINDTYGHATGDEVLKFVTHILEEATRDTDFIGRWGGDEFIVILSNTSYENCMRVANKLKELDKTYQNESITISVDFSMGCVQSQKDVTSDELIHQADMKLYAEKNKKR